MPELTPTTLRTVFAQPPTRCLVKVAGGPCARPPVWDLLVRCDGGHKLGAGPACDEHKREAEGGLVHLSCGGWITLVQALPLYGD